MFNLGQICRNSEAKILKPALCHQLPVLYSLLCNNQINAHPLIGQSAVGYCTGKPTEKLRVF